MRKFHRTHQLTGTKGDLHMFRSILKVLLPVLVTLSLSLGALAWSASSVAFAASQPNQGVTAPTPTPTGSAYYSPSPYYGPNAGNNAYNADNGFKTRNGEEGVERQTGCDTGRDERGLFRNSGGSVCRK